MGAVAPLVENYLEASFRTIWWKRSVWLSCLFVAEMFTFTALAHFEDSIQEDRGPGLFVPLCISTGGNSGSQAATLITRAMALGQVTLRDWWRVLRHELLMGMALGCTLGVHRLCRRAISRRRSVLGGADPCDVRTGDCAGRDGDLPVGHAGRLDAAAWFFAVWASTRATPPARSWPRSST